MNKRILIIDDDHEFTALLRGIFEQAEYTVQTADNAEYAYQLMESEPVDLVVTDHRLPGGMTGSELIHKIREHDNRVPVIMVSGYLNDDGIRDLIKHGVQGVFIKPLNIFSLLKKASEIIEKNQKGQGRANSEDGESGATHSSNAIGQIEGLSAKGKEFVTRSIEAAAFKRNLLLIGPPGTLFEEIGRDIVSYAEVPQRCMVLGPGQVTEAALSQLFTGEQAEEPLTLILKDAEHFDTGEERLLIDQANQMSGTPGLLRMIFCLAQSVEALYDAGKVDEEYYLFLGTNELVIPALREMPEDMLAIAKREILEQSTDATFDMRIRTMLLEHDWPENMLELRSVIVRAIQLALPIPPISKHFRAALNPGEEETDMDMRSSLERFLLEEKRRYQAARNFLQHI